VRQADAVKKWKKDKPLLLTDTGVSDELRKLPEDWTKQILISKNLQPAQVVAHAMSYRAGKMHQPEQEVGHGAEQGAVPTRSADA
jgi:hypothetical protein